MNPNVPDAFLNAIGSRVFLCSKKTESSTAPGKIERQKVQIKFSRVNGEADGGYQVLSTMMA